MDNLYFLGKLQGVTSTRIQFSCTPGVAQRKELASGNQMGIVHTFRAMKFTFFVLNDFTENFNEFKCQYISTSIFTFYLSILGRYLWSVRYRYKSPSWNCRPNAANFIPCFSHSILSSFQKKRKHIYLPNNNHLFHCYFISFIFFYFIILI